MCYNSVNLILKSELKVSILKNTKKYDPINILKIMNYQIDHYNFKDTAVDCLK